MRQAGLAAALLLLTALAGGCVRYVKFDGLAAGTEWKGATHPPGTVVHTEDGIDVRVQAFSPYPGNTYNKAHVDPKFTPDGGVHSVRTNNANLEFDFTGLPFTPSKVTLDFYDTGGNENLSINGFPLIVGELISGGVPGLTWTVTLLPTPNNRLGKLEITGNVEKLVIGGQEFWLDTICARR